LSRLSLPLLLGFVCCGASIAGACDTGVPAQPVAAAAPFAAQPASANDASSAPPFQPETPDVYVAKVKNLLVGLPPSASEIQTVTSNPANLPTLITGWMALPEYQTKMLRFFELAFQQTQLSITDFEDESSPRVPDLNASTTPLLVENLQESFARTMLALVADGQPLNSAFTTTQFMLTPALMELYAFLDAWEVDDNSVVTDYVAQANPGKTITVEASRGPIPLSETLDPTNANYMTWYDPDLAQAATDLGPGCATDPLVLPMNGSNLHYLMYGSILATKSSNEGTCLQFDGTAAAPQLVASDFENWTMVTIRAPAPGEATTRFYDLSTLRSATELVLNVPRVGFFSTPAFGANWQTNTSNQMRVTMNQALIVALGSAVDGTDPTVPPSTPGLDTVHADTPACVACHQTLDPTRSILAANWSWNYHTQTDPTYSSQDGLFAFRGVIQNVTSLGGLGTTLAQHPLFPAAWVQKLCYYANSEACDATDPEFQRLVGLFTSSKFSWTALVEAFFASPLTTYATSTQTAATQGEVIAVSRRDHLCAALDARLGFTDICGLLATSTAAEKTAIPEIVAGLPSDGYGRGAAAPVLPNQPTLFFRAGTENICEAVAALVIDVPMAQQQAGVTQWSSSQPDAAIADFVATVMALTPSDPRSTPAEALLKSHFASAMQQGASATAALQSTFVAACLAPSAVSIGM
jgi:hypothetical protein